MVVVEDIKESLMTTLTTSQVNLYLRLFICVFIPSPSAPPTVVVCHIVESQAIHFYDFRI